MEKDFAVSDDKVPDSIVLDAAGCAFTTALKPRIAGKDEL
jgi:hypothetical protein